MSRKAETCECCGRDLPILEICDFCGHDNHKTQIGGRSTKRICKEIAKEGKARKDSLNDM